MLGVRSEARVMQHVIGSLAAREAGLLCSVGSQQAFGSQGRPGCCPRHVEHARSPLRTTVVISLLWHASLVDGIHCQGRLL